MPSRIVFAPIIGLLTLALTGCYSTLPSTGGGQTRAPAPSASAAPNPADVALPAGYRIEVAATGLTFPTSVTFDEQNRPYVVEAGYSYGEKFTTPRLLRIDGLGKNTVIVEGANGPWTGAVFHDGSFYIAEGGELNGGAIARIGPDHARTALIEHLPSMGDHHTNGPAVGSDGFIYFGVGTATNAGVVGRDDYEFGWLKRHPDFHDIPAKDIKLAGTNYTSDNPLKPGTKALTGAYLPFATPSTPGQIIPGRLPCTGAILRIPLQGGSPQLVAWGLRNPFGLAFAPDGALYITENSYDVRGSRPVWGCGDVLWRIQPGLWYGWPDYAAGEPLNDDSRFKPPGDDPPKLVLAEHPNTPPKPAAILGVHASANGLDFSRNGAFGYVGDAFIAEFGDMAPKVGKVEAPVGFSVVRVNVQSGVIEPFATNRSGDSGPASLLKTHGLERPIAARFDNTGTALYIVDFGVLTMDEKGAHPQGGTGVLWRITREAKP